MIALPPCRSRIVAVTFRALPGHRGGACAAGHRGRAATHPADARNGTGQTFIAFQIAWKLFQSRWNLTREPARRPRILFLADRNILADQAYNAFSAFADDALVRIAPDDIRKKGQVPKNGNIFFTIFQTFMSGQESSLPRRRESLQTVWIPACAGMT